MSAARNQLRAIVKLTGLTPEHVAEQAEIPIKRIHEVLDSDWPLPKKHREPLAMFTRLMLRRAYTIAIREVEAKPDMRTVGAHTYLTELLATYDALFGVSLPSDTTDSDSEAGDKIGGAQ